MCVMTTMGYFLYNSLSKPLKYHSKATKGRLWESFKNDKRWAPGGARGHQAHGLVDAQVGGGGNPGLGLRGNQGGGWAGGLGGQEPIQ